MVEAERLGALINGHPEKVPAALPKLLELLTSGNDPTTLATVIAALGRAWDEKAGLAVLPYASHAYDRVRLAVARAAPRGVASLGAKEAVADVLIRLSRDPGCEIRGWATFGLGSILDLDSPAVRRALVDRLADEDIDTSCEALVGLAERHDERAFQVTVELLTSESVPRLAVAAARALADHRLLPALEALRGWWDVDVELLGNAIAACSLRTRSVEPAAESVPECPIV
jgi:HEAT repeat protein